MTNGDLAIAEGLLEQCRAWQEVIDAQGSPKAMDRAAEDAQQLIRLPEDKPPMYVHGESAIITSADHPDFSASGSLALGFGDVTVRGVFSSVAYLRLRSGRGVLTWMIGSPEVKSTREVSTEEAAAEFEADEPSMPLGRALYLPVHFPVSGIKGAMFAGRDAYRLRQGTVRIRTN